MEIDDKGGEIVQRYERYGETLYKGKRQDMDMNKGGATLKKRRIKILGQEKHTNRGSKIMNFV